MALPPTSPRLPSPPPAAEIQIGPKSPAMSGATLAQQQMELHMEQTILDANSKRRIHPGTRASDFAAGPPLVPLNELDSAFQLQEHLSALHYHHTANNTQAITRDTALLLAQAPAGTDRTLWLYELCRFLIAQCNSLIIGFLFDTPPCSAATCPEMRASEWQFLCAVHEQPRSCCAIDYCCHTLDWAANVVTNPKIFPSRFAFADQHDKNAAMKNLINVFRRLHRIFAHAWFQHRGVFWSVEGQTGLYVFFKTVCDMYDLLPAENYKLPPEAEGLDASGSFATSGVLDLGSGIATAKTGANAENTPGLIPMAAITDRKGMGFTAGVLNHRPGSGSSSTNSLGTELLSGENSIGRTNTRRHIRSSPSTGSAVTTVLEQDEDSNSSSPFAPSRPLTILQHADRLSAPVSKGAAVPASVPTPPISQEPSDDAAEPKASVAEVEVKGSVDDAGPAEEPAIIVEATKDEEAVTTEEALPEGNMSEAPAPATEAEAEAETEAEAEAEVEAEAQAEPEADKDTPATAEEPVTETADKDAEATESSSEESAEVSTEETKGDVTDAEADTADNTTTEAEAEAKSESASNDSPAASGGKEEADKPSTTAKAVLTDE